MGNYRQQIEVEVSSETSHDGIRSITTTVRAENKLFDATNILEAKGALPAIEERLKEAVQKEVIKALRDVDFFLKVARRSMKTRGVKHRRKNSMQLLESDEQEHENTHTRSTPVISPK